MYLKLMATLWVLRLLKMLEGPITFQVRPCQCLHLGMLTINPWKQHQFPPNRLSNDTQNPNVSPTLSNQHKLCSLFVGRTNGQPSKMTKTNDPILLGNGYVHSKSTDEALGLELLISVSPLLVLWICRSHSAACRVSKVAKYSPLLSQYALASDHDKSTSWNPQHELVYGLRMYDFGHSENINT